MSSKLFIIVIGILSILLCSCFNQVAGDNEGSGAETTNGISGVIRNNKGGLGGVSVMLYPAKFNPVLEKIPPSMITVTKDDGTYEFNVETPGEYKIEATMIETNYSALIQDIVFPEERNTFIIASETYLNPTGSLNIQLTELSIESGGYIYIPGTRFSIFINNEHISKGNLLLKNLPATTYTDIIYSNPNNTNEIPILSGSIKIASNSESNLNPFASWSSSAKININTTSSGANISQDILNFPMMIRFTEGSLLFQNSPIDGSDVRFLKKDGVTTLPFQIEHWDPIGKQVIIWVLIDTIYSNNQDQYFYMYWGKSNQPHASNSEMVFNEKNHYSAVWHLNESLEDATPNKNSGVDFNTSVIQGILGYARGFNGIDNYINFGNAPSLNPKNITVEAWIKSEIDIDTMTADDMNIIRHGRNYTAIQLGPNQNFPARSVSWVTTQTDSIYHNPSRSIGFDWSLINDGTWHYFVSTYSSITGSKIYVDGIEASSDDTQLGELVPALEDFLIGSRFWGVPASGTASFFRGQLDEIRVSSERRDSNWIRLNYESQRPGGSVITLE